jgi:hypothetical protein
MKYLPIYILLICIILFFSYYNSFNTDKENFTPHIRRFYRPYLRNTRIYTDNFYNKMREHFHRFLRKTGLIK